MRRSLAPLLLVIAILLVAFQTACQLVAPASTPPKTQVLAPTKIAGVSVELPAIQSPTSTPTRIRPTLTPMPTATSTPPGLALLDVDPERFGIRSGKSLDGRWLWAIEPDIQSGEKNEYGCHRTRFASADGSAYWVVRPELYQLGPNHSAEISYRPIFWMPNDPFVYLVGDVELPKGLDIRFLTGFNLIRLNLNTGAVAVQVPGLAVHDFAFSPNGKYLADIAQTESDQVLRIRTLPDGEFRQIPLLSGFSQNGKTLFSPDDKLAVVQSCIRSKPNQPDCERTALLVVNPETGRFKELMPDLEAALGSLLPGKFSSPQLSWVDAYHIHLDFPAWTKITGSWQIDARTARVHKVVQ